ncbi:aspartyl protease family protein 1-like [Typha angustifolia]|uniref:aspartyl protease family protein 1-like n=1 Tax=Typha angustifolia TaxID=59011 RepID=UPI003C2FF9B4
MASFSSPLSVLLLFVVAAASVAEPSGAATLGLDFYHRFSEPVRRWAESSGHRGAAWPRHGTAEYYAALAHHDRALHRRSLADASGQLTFADGNSTFRISSLGYLHYALVALGTPNVTFLVALDTGSDLFWVPCDCKQCAPTTSPRFGDLEFSIYSPKLSSTSQNIPCNSSLCGVQNACSGATSSCPYLVQYLSDNTSSSGILVEDVMYLTTEASRSKVVQAPIIFGCGQVQTGSFLDGAAPNGLFGLGLENISVPSILSSKGFASDSFSMCFGNDGIGRINFGDKGSSDQEETPLNIYSRHPTYNISLTGVEIGNTSTSTDFSAIVDSGTSFTYLADPIYSQITRRFNAQIKESRHQLDPSLPFEYCYDLSPSQTTIQLPVINFITKGGSVFPVNDSIIVISSTKNQYGYCLAIVKSNNVNIIGQNFMNGLRIVFDRERLILGWKNFNCYSVEDSSTLPVNRNSSASPPTEAFAPSSYTPEATKGSRNTTQVTVLTPRANNSSHLNAMTSILLLLLLLVPAFF